MGLILSPDIEHTLRGIFSTAFKQKSNIATNSTYLNARVDPLFICFNKQWGYIWFFFPYFRQEGDCLKAHDLQVIKRKLSKEQQQQKEAQ